MSRTPPNSTITEEEIRKHFDKEHSKTTPHTQKFGPSRRMYDKGPDKVNSHSVILCKVYFIDCPSTVLIF